VALATQRKSRIHRTTDANIGLNRQRHQIQTVPDIAQEHPAMFGNMGSNGRSQENAGNILQVQSHRIRNEVD
jgi:hypothetical protein